MLRLAFDFIITWRETRTRPNAYLYLIRMYMPMARIMTIWRMISMPLRIIIPRIR